MSEIKITKEMLDELDYDEPILGTKVQQQQPKAPSAYTIMIVFAHSDIHSAVYYLVRSLGQEYDNQKASRIGCVLVQESVAKQFIAMLQTEMKPLKDKIKTPEYETNERAIREKQAKIIFPSVCENKADVYPQIVCTFTHEYLGIKFGSVVTFDEFRTAKESIALCQEQSVNRYDNVSIWTKDHACAYELVAALPCSNYFINCMDAPLDVLRPYIEKKTSFVTMDKTYHFETLANVGEKQKNVVFPYGTIFAN